MKRFKKSDRYIKHQAKSYSSFDPLLKIGGAIILFICLDIAKKRMFKYVGIYIQDDLGLDRVSDLSTVKSSLSSY